MEPFKNLLNARLIEASARHLHRAWPGFDRATFVERATHGLDGLEMKARAMRIADALEATLPDDYARAAEVIEAALAPAFEHERLSEMETAEHGLAGWILWPVGEYVARRGLASPERALATLAEITQRFSAEFAIRPFIVAHPELAFSTLAGWTSHSNPHVRRLVSEGSRPRLPWGLRLNALVADPTPTLPLLLALQDDPSEYVRRSVANHLNDIAKDHPQRVAEWLDAHLPGASEARRALLKHASRTLIKQGDARVLAAWGLGRRFRGEVEFSIRPPRAALGGEVLLDLSLRTKSREAQTLVIDYIVHHVKAGGGTSPKVFKGWTLVLPARGSVTLARRHSLKPVTTRRYFAGVHRVQVQINGAAVAEASFVLRVPNGS